MKWSATICGFAVAAFSVAATAADPPNEQLDSRAVTIPLDQIWGFNIPGTRDAQNLDPLPPGKRFMEIRRSIWSLPPKQKNAGPAFAVSGDELESLRGVHAVLVEGKKSQQTFSPNSGIYVAFFSYQTRPYVHLHKVERQGNVVNIRWQFVPHETEETTEHFALIPLGKLTAGKYRVNIIRSPMPQKYIDLGFRPTSDVVADRSVSKSFSFEVVGEGR